MRAGTPTEIIARVNQAIVRILNQPDVLDRLRTDGYDPVGSTPQEFARIIARDIGTWSKVVKAGNIKAD